MTNTLDILIINPPRTEMGGDAIAPALPPVRLLGIARLMRYAGYSVELLDSAGERMSLRQIVLEVKSRSPRIVLLSDLNSNASNSTIKQLYAMLKLVV